MVGRKLLVAMFVGLMIGSVGPGGLAAADTTAPHAPEGSTAEPSMAQAPSDPDGAAAPASAGAPRGPEDPATSAVSGDGRADTPDADGSVAQHEDGTVVAAVDADAGRIAGASMLATGAAHGATAATLFGATATTLDDAAWAHVQKRAGELARTADVAVDACASMEVHAQPGMLRTRDGGGCSDKADAVRMPSITIDLRGSDEDLLKVLCETADRSVSGLLAPTPLRVVVAIDCDDPLAVPRLTLDMGPMPLAMQPMDAPGDGPLIETSADPQAPPALATLVGMSLAGGMAVLAVAVVAAHTAPGSAGLRLRRWLVSLVAPLYARLAKSELLDHAARQEIVAVVEATPGIHTESIAKATGRARNTVGHHLRSLEAAGLIVAVRNGRRRCWFTPEAIPTRQERVAIAVCASPAARKALATVTERPGIAQGELAAALGVSQTAARAQAHRLTERGLLRRERAGRTVLYYPVAA